MQLRFLTLLFVVAHSSSAQSPVPTAEAEFARRVAGCYRLDDGAWRAESVRAGDVSTAHTPLFFELTDQRLGGWEPLQSREHPMFVVRDSARVFAYWQHVGKAGDMIRVSQPLQLAGVELALTRAGHDLAGKVTAFTDAVEMDKPSEVERRVRARRVACVRAP